jgi:nucleoside-diphosphate-sugar epimerase
MEKILVIGALGQLGSELTASLAEKHGLDNVIATDIKPFSAKTFSCKYFQLDALNKEAILKSVQENAISQIYHLAAILSAKGEQNPSKAWDINMTSLLNVLEVGKEMNSKIYWPSSIAVFGSGTPKENTPQNTVMDPNTVYGISKLAGERWCEYYFQKYAVDVRSLRYPGLIGWRALPGGGTTDYAVEIYHHALQSGEYTCFLEKNTRLPMMYMDDAVRATIELMDAPARNIRIRSSYNVAAMSFSPAEIAKSIAHKIPGFRITYSPDFRQKIAESWPASIDDMKAREDWNWQHEFDLEKMTAQMLANLEQTINK